MPFTHSITRSYRDSSGTPISGQENITNNTELNFDDSFNDGTTNGEVDWTSTVANLKSVLLYCDKNVTLKTNSSGSPQETITLLAGIPQFWSLATDGSGKIPFAGNVTKMYITNSSGSAANLKIRALADQTP